MIRTTITYRWGLYNHLLTYICSDFIKNNVSINTILIAGATHNTLRVNWTSKLYLSDYVKVIDLSGIPNGISYVTNDKGQRIHFISAECGKEEFKPYLFDLVINDRVKDNGILAELECRLINSKHNELITIT